MDSFLSKPFLLGKSRGASGAFALQRRLGSPQGLFLDFTDDSSLIIDGAVPANNYRGKVFDKLTFTRASTRKRFDPSASLADLASDVPAIDYDPVTRAVLGFQPEGARTNLLLNSDSLSTQSVTVTAAVHTLSFYGTGTVTLSGASTAGPLTGSAAFPTRSTLTFTPSAGTLTLTVTGTVQYAQLELGAIPSSYIPTAGATVTRAAEVCKIATTLFPATAQGPYTIFAKGIMPPTNASDSTRVPVALSIGSSPQVRYFAKIASGNIAGTNVVSSVTDASTGNVVVAPFNPVKMAARFDLNNCNTAINGTLGTTDTACAYPSAPTQLNIGNFNDGSASHWHGWIQQIAVIPVALTDAQLQAVTA